MQAVDEAKKNRIEKQAFPVHLYRNVCASSEFCGLTQNNRGEMRMRFKLLIGTAALAAALPLAANAQGVIGGTERGAAEGGAAAGPVGAVVGGVVGGVTGGVAGVLGVDERPRFREYVVREHVPSYRYAEPLRPGVVLPEEGVRYYDVPAEYGRAHGYRYTVVNEHPVLVEPRTRRVIEVIE
jgi:hypothetical protein